MSKLITRIKRLALALVLCDAFGVMGGGCADD